jgi:hypothetical protein
MAAGAVLLRTDGINTPFQKTIKALVGVFLIDLPISPDESLELGKKNSSIWFRSGEYGGKYTSLTPALEHISSIRSE